MKTVSVILAGGLGLRMGSDKPKQFLEIADKPIVIHSLEAFEQHPAIDEMILVVNAAFQEAFYELLEKYHFSKLKAVTVGGKERSDSSKNALKLIAPSKGTKVLIHDAVRPFVSDRIIANVVAALDSYAAVNVGIPATDTVLITNAQQEIAAMPLRSKVFLAQTPQGFDAALIHKAYEQAAKDSNFVATDDCGVVHRYFPEIPIRIVAGSVENRKITFPSDLSS